MALEALAWSGALSGLPDGERARALWSAGTTAAPPTVPGAGQASQPPLPFPPTEAPELDEPEGLELVRAEYESTGVALGEHPMEMLRSSAGVRHPGLYELRGLPHGARAEAVGIVRIMQKPATAKGTCFVLLEDETEVLNLIVPPRLARASRLLLRTARTLCARGRIEREGEVVNLICTDLLSFPASDSGKIHPLSSAPARQGFRGV